MWLSHIYIVGLHNKMKPKLFSYSIQHDTGYAPNPFHGICTLNPCKPQIRREAIEGDWVVGCKKNRVVYIMKVTAKISMKNYWSLCKNKYPKKIPSQDKFCIDPILLCGDSQYDFSGKIPKQLLGCHGKNEFETDLGGKYTLISTNFIYFGNKSVILPQHLLGIAQDANGKWITRARKSIANEPFIKDFNEWFQSMKKLNKNTIGSPLHNIQKKIL